jgi:acetyltransferase-like isoleucine patch superfamily enzyme
VPRGLAKVVRKGLERNRDRRYRNLDELRAALVAQVPGQMGISGLGIRFSAMLIDTVLVLPAFLLYRLGALLLGPEKAFPGWSQAFSLLPGLTGVYLRRAFYRLVFRRCGSGSWIGFGTVFSHAGCSVGRDVYVGAFCCLGEVTLEDDVLVGSHVSVTNGSAQHGTARLDVPVREQPGEWPHVTVGRDSWIGDRAVVMANVGRHCVIGAGSVVTRPIPDWAIAFGTPARVVKLRGGPPPPPDGASTAEGPARPLSVDR